jgi:intermediate cleaving peptidase 55
MLFARGLRSGSRENALVIHYTRNDHLLRDGELVLMDAGGEYKYVSLHVREIPELTAAVASFYSGYASDIC